LRDGTPYAVEAVVGILGSSRLLIRPHSRFNFLFSSMKRIRVESAPMLDIWSDDVELPHRLLADVVMTRTLPLAITRSCELEIGPRGVRATKRVVDGQTGDAIAAAKALAIAVVSSLRLPPPERTV
jgi:hypothetical protein